LGLKFGKLLSHSANNNVHVAKAPFLFSYDAQNDIYITYRSQRSI